MKYSISRLPLLTMTVMISFVNSCIVTAGQRQHGSAHNETAAPPILILGEQSNSTSKLPQGASGQIYNVTVAPNNSLSFFPSTLNIHTGDTVKWTWGGSGHTVTSGPCSPTCTTDSKFCSPNDTNCGTSATSNAGATYSHTFLQAGTFPYFCRIHPASMRGTVTVTDAVCVTPPANLVGWWPGDGNAFDFASGNHGTLMGDVSFPGGFVAQAFSLNGTNAFVQVAHNDVFDPTTAGSQDAWVLFNQTPATSHTMEIIGQGSFGRDFDLQADTDNIFRFYIGSGNAGSVFASSTTVIQTGVWYHVAGTWDSSAIKIYVNGALEGTNPTTNIVREPSGEPLMIGNQPFFGPRLFNGLIDEAEVFNRALTASEVAAIYNAETAGKCKAGCIPPPANMIDWWRGDGNASDSVSGFSGTLQNGAGFNAGKVDQAFSLNSSAAQYISLPDIPALNFGAGDFTFDFWALSSASAVRMYALAFDSDPTDPTTPRNLDFDFNDGGFGLWVYWNSGGIAANSIRVATTSDYTDGNWHHFALTRSGGTMSLYINGVLAGSADVTGETFDLSNSAANYIGATTDLSTAEHAPGRFWNGMIDEVEIFNRALSSTEVAAIYAVGSNGKCKTSAPLKITSINRPANQHIIITGQTLPNALVKIEPVPNLNTAFSSTNATEVTADSTGAFQLDDAAAVTLQMQFYRAVYP